MICLLVKSEGQRCQNIPKLGSQKQVVCIKTHYLRLQSHGAIYLPDSFVLVLRYCVNLKAIRYESTSFNRIVADKSHRVIVALGYNYTVRFMAPIPL